MFSHFTQCVHKSIELGGFLKLGNANCKIFLSCSSTLFVVISVNAMINSVIGNCFASAYDNRHHQDAAEALGLRPTASAALLPLYRLTPAQDLRRPVAETDLNYQPQLPASEEFLTCLFPFFCCPFVPVAHALAWSQLEMFSALRRPLVLVESLI